MRHHNIQKCKRSSSVARHIGPWSTIWSTADRSFLLQQAFDKVRVVVGVNNYRLYSTIQIGHPGAKLNSMNKAYRRSHWGYVIKALHTSNMWTAMKESIMIEGIIPLFVNFGTVEERKLLDVVENLAANIVLSTTYIDFCIKRIFPMHKKTVRMHSKVGPILDSNRGLSKIWRTPRWKPCSLKVKVAMNHWVRNQLTIPAKTGSPGIVSRHHH